MWMVEITKGEIPGHNEGSPCKGPLDIPAFKGQEKPIEEQLQKGKWSCYI